MPRGYSLYIRRPAAAWIRSLITLVTSLRTSQTYILAALRTGAACLRERAGAGGSNLWCMRWGSGCGDNPIATSSTWRTARCLSPPGILRRHSSSPFSPYGASAMSGGGGRPTQQTSRQRVGGCAGWSTSTTFRRRRIRRGSVSLLTLSLYACHATHMVDPVPVSPGPPAAPSSDHVGLSAAEVAEYVDAMDSAACEGLMLCGARTWETMEECRSGIDIRRFRRVLPYEIELFVGVMPVRGSPTELEACLEQLRGECPAVGLGPQLAHWLNREPDSCWQVFRVPRVGSNDECVSRLQCPTGNYCAGPSTRECGPPQCRPRLPPGLACTHSTQCAGDNDPDTFTACTGMSFFPRIDSIGRCRVGSLAAEPTPDRCGWEVDGDTRAELHRCPDGKMCDRGRCVAVPDVDRTPLEAGDDCRYPDLRMCDISLRYDCVGNRCVAWGDGSLGSSCVLSSCRPGLYCLDRVCQPALALGSRCGMHPPPSRTAVSPELSHLQCLSLCCGLGGECIEPPPVTPGQPRVPL